LAAQSLLVINGWTIFVHPLFLDEIDKLITKTEEFRRKDPATFHKKNTIKRLAAIAKLAFEVIPLDPSLPDYRQGNTLGEDHKHWFRAKFFQQYRLFFRFDSVSKIILYAWVNDENSKRAYGSKSDAYRVFEKMLHSGNPPDDWTQLLAEAQGQLDHLNHVAQKLLG